MKWWFATLGGEQLWKATTRIECLAWGEGYLAALGISARDETGFELAWQPARVIFRPAFERQARIDATVLYHGDCQSILPTIPSGSVDAIVTDPP